MDFSGRLKIICDQIGGAPELIRRSKVSRETVYRALKGNSDIRSSAVVDLCKPLGISAHWLLTGEGSMYAGDTRAHTTNIALVPHLNVSATAGHGYINDGHRQVIEQIPFPNQFFQRLNRTVKADGTVDDVVIISAVGDSMQPTINSGDIVMIDERAKTIVDGIHALYYDGGTHIKRVRVIKGGIELVSDNPNYRTEQIPYPETQDIHVFGRVVWIGHYI